MTITYTAEVASCRGFGCFLKLLFRWKGSIYKLVWPDLLAYTFLYYCCSFLYRFVLNPEQRTTFEGVALHCQQFTDLIPVSFVLGFYVSIVIQRWWAQYELLPFPDSLALYVSTSIHGQDERSRLMRRTVLRYVNLTEVITLIMISPRVKKRFPTLEHLVDAGFLTPNEKKIFDDLDSKTAHPKYWMPLVWAGSIVTRARKEGRIRDDFAVKTIIDEINRFRGLCGGLLSYDWISIPLVYTQVVTLSVYVFFLGTIMGHQFLDTSKNYPNHRTDLYVPMFTFLQFFFYMGWLKVAESLVNPFGEDDDDFEVNWLVDRNLQVSYLIVDEMHCEYPDLVQDLYWDEVFPQELPYTIAAEQYKREPPQGSTANIEVPEIEQEFLPLLEEENEENLLNIQVNDENNKTTPINIASSKERTGSILSSRSGIGASLSSVRKNSMLSMILNRITSGSQERERRKSGRLQGSTQSIRKNHSGKPHRGINRSSSKVSSFSRVNSHSPGSVTRNRTNVSMQESDIFRMSGLSLDAFNENQGLNNPRSSIDEEGPIIIKIKRRDKDGNVLSSPAHDEGDTRSESSRTKLLPAKMSGTGTGATAVPSMKTAEQTNMGSSCSIRTSIFQGDEDDSYSTGEMDPQDNTIRPQSLSMNSGFTEGFGSLTPIHDTLYQSPIERSTRITTAQQDPPKDPFSCDLSMTQGVSSPETEEQINLSSPGIAHRETMGRRINSTEKELETISEDVLETRTDEMP
ncbi:bestrophin-2-like isoform X2 [Oratosquilla oratoria]|uniref:bestrophin-2-like isoform X2 n=1 Tax=Oratosquilla oratoria TaxID=337810 RepID=UPI003F77164A